MTIMRLGVPYPIIADPNSCALCGWPERGHAQWYFGPHLEPGQPKTYVAPDDATRLARMKARREARLRGVLGGRFRLGPFGLFWWYEDDEPRFEPVRRAGDAVERDRAWQEQLLRDLDAAGRPSPQEEA